ncbi:helix-turn-helix domain-containing protein [Actinopolymorpha pittospori]
MAKAPLDSRRRLGGELRRLRLAAKLSGPELARRLEVGQATVSRMETGQVRPSLETVERWLEATGAAAKVRRSVIDLAEDAQVDVTGWRSVFRGGMAPQQRQTHQFHAAATAIRHFQPFMVPGYFQSAGYARGALLGFRLTDQVADIEQTVEARVERRKLLIERTEISYHLIVTELGLRALPAGATEQDRSESWTAMLDAAKLPHVTVQIIPADAPMEQLPICGWTTFDLPDGSVDPMIVQVETPAAMLTFSGPDVRPFELGWERMLASALSPEQSTKHLRRMLGRK